jgi:hypothetical protein
MGYLSGVVGRRERAERTCRLAELTWRAGGNLLLGHAAITCSGSFVCRIPVACCPYREERTPNFSAHSDTCGTSCAHCWNNTIEVHAEDLKHREKRPPPRPPLAAGEGGRDAAD